MSCPARMGSVGVVTLAIVSALGGLLRAEDRVVMTLPRFGTEATHRVVSVDAATREARIANVEDRFFFQSSEGQALLVVPGRDGGDPDTVVRVEVVEILDDGSVRATFGPGAAGVVRQGPALLGRPFSGDLAGGPPKAASTKALRGLPDVVRPLAEEAPRDGARPDALSAARAAARRVKSMNNLKQLGLAFHNYADAMGRFPPPAVIGPDGKPWHSWRVLLLPYLDQGDLYRQYDFSQPWDSPKNRAVAEKMPALFRDPAREGPPDAFTDYAAIVGEHTIFPSGRVTMKDANDFPACLARDKTVSFPQVTDGTSNTIMFATVDPARRIRWTAPDDIVFGADFPGVGKAGGIGAIHPAKEDMAGLAVFTDGSAQVIAAATDRDTVTALVTRDGGEVVDRGALSGAGDAQPAGGMAQVRIVAGSDGTLRAEVQ